MWMMRILHEGGGVQEVPLTKKEVTLGRSRENDITIPDSAVSRHHARLMETGEGFRLTDLGSFNGTEVNGRLVQDILLRDGDRIRIGRTRILFYSGARDGEPTSDSLVFTAGDDERSPRPIIESRAEVGGREKTRDLLLSSPIPGREGESIRVPSSEEDRFKAGLSTLERSNKVLFVLYEISRQLNMIHDFNELLNKIMDLIFMVIDADYGFLVLTGEEENNEMLVPVVVKSRHDSGGSGRELKASRTIIRRVIRDKVALLTSNAMADNRLDHAKSLFIKQIRSAICVPLWKKDKIIGVIQLDSVRLDNQFTQEDLELLKAIGSQMALVIEQASLNQKIREEERMRNRLGRFIPPQVIDLILKGGQELMEPKDLTATVLFADIVGFTNLSEKMPPRETTLFLNRFFSRMTDIVFKHDGTLDKYMGDGLMAVFGAPVEKRDDPERAVRAAKEMLAELNAMPENLAGGKRIRIRIGINTGQVVAGNIGSPRRMDYTVIGDAVNTASRLESLAAPNQILIGEETYRSVRGKLKVREVGPCRIKGKSDEIMVYEVV